MRFYLAMLNILILFRSVSLLFTLFLETCNSVMSMIRIMTRNLKCILGAILEKYFCYYIFDHLFFYSIQVLPIS